MCLRGMSLAEIYWVRHGEAAFATDNYDRLTARGIQQASLLGEYFQQRNIQFDQLVSGTMIRQQHTLSLLSQSAQDMTLKASHEQTPLANEYDFEQLTKQYATQYPQTPLVQQWQANSSDKKLFFSLLREALSCWSHGDLNNVDETFDGFEQRIKQLISKMQNYHGKKVLIVSSGGVISTVLGKLMQMPPTAMFELNLQMRNTGISQCFFNKKIMRVSSFNAIPHLETPNRQTLVSY
jgi:broad specificity phosphatase PhoE